MEELYWQASTIARDAINALLRFTTGFNQTLVHAVLNQLNGLDAQASGLTQLAPDAAEMPADDVLEIIHSANEAKRDV